VAVLFGPDFINQHSCAARADDTADIAFIAGDVNKSNSQSGSEVHMGKSRLVS
jgi:hypothetical protein